MGARVPFLAKHPFCSPRLGQVWLDAAEMGRSVRLESCRVQAVSWGCARVSVAASKIVDPGQGCRLSRESLEWEDKGNSRAVPLAGMDLRMFSSVSLSLFRVPTLNMEVSRPACEAN